MESQGIIYDDLGIDYSNYFKDYESFGKDVHSKASELVDILKATSSVSVYLSTMPESSGESLSFVDSKLNELYDWISETVETADLSAVATKLRKLATSVEYIAKDRAYLELAKTNGAFDKAVVHDQYKKLRESFNRFVGALDILHPGHNIAKLPPMPGNYSPAADLTYRVFRFDDEEDTYRMHKSVAKRLGMANYIDVTLQDVIEYIQQHPDSNVTISEIEP